MRFLEVTIRWCALPLLLGISACDLVDDFATEKGQRKILHSYYPEVDCNDAHFKLVEQQDAFQDYRYVVRIWGSRKCLNSLRMSLRHRNFIYAPKRYLGGWQPPSQDSETEAVAFDFVDETDVVYWTRDKT